MKKEKYYILYNYNEFKNDLEYIKEYNNINEIQKEFKLKNKKSIYNYIIKNIDDKSSYNNLLNNKYVIIKECY